MDAWKLGCNLERTFVRGPISCNTWTRCSFGICLFWPRPVTLPDTSDRRHRSPFFSVSHPISDPCTFPYSLFILGHCLAHSVHVYNPLCLAQSRGLKIISVFPPPLACPPPCALRPLRTPCRAIGAACAHGLRRHVLPLDTHTHTHTHSLSLSLSLSLPAGGCAINNRQSAFP